MKIKDMVDELGKVKAQLAELSVLEDQLVTAIKDHGAGVRSGKLFDANVFWSSRAKVDWDAVVAEAHVPRRIVRKHTSNKDFLVCAVTARVSKRRKVAA